MNTNFAANDFTQVGEEVGQVAQSIFG